MENVMLNLNWLQGTTSVLSFLISKKFLEKSQAEVSAEAKDHQFNPVAKFPLHPN